MTAAFGLGANLGHPAETLRAAVAALQSVLRHLRVSPLYLTEPVSDLTAARTQPWFYNLVVVGLTCQQPRQLLDFGRSLEAAAGRVRCALDAPRVLDVDLLVYGDLLSDDPELTLPHPRLRGRRFVLAPLADVAPDLPIPPDGATPARLLADLQPGEAVQRIPWPPRR